VKVIGGVFSQWNGRTLELSAKWRDLFFFQPWSTLVEFNPRFFFFFLKTWLPFATLLHIKLQSTRDFKENIWSGERTKT